MLESKAYNYIKDGIAQITANPENQALWPWEDWTKLVEHLGKQYKIIDMAQVAKNKLDHFPQGNRSY